MFDLTRCTSSSPACEIVENWIKVLSNHLKSTVNYSEHLREILVNRANFVRLKFKKLLLITFNFRFHSARVIYNNCNDNVNNRLN